MRNDYKEMQGQLNALADWIEKSNNVHADSLPRRAAYTIAKLEEENYQMRLRLNKRDMDLSDYINRGIGLIRLNWYLLKRKMNTVKK
jgi:hypothetical protein